MKITNRMGNKLLTAVLTCVFCLFFGGGLFVVGNQVAYAYAGENQTENVYDFVDNQVLVTLDNRVGGVNKEHDESFFGDIAISSITDLTYRPEETIKNVDTEKFRQILKLELEYHDKDYVLTAIEKINKIKGVESAAPNYVGSLAAAVNDSSSWEQWGLDDENGIHIEDAWNITVGSKNVRVGVIDTGIALHEDLVGNLDIGRNFVSGIPNDTDTDDTNGHGTHVAGIIGAQKNNKKKISGVCQIVELVPLKISNTGIDIPSSIVVDAINYADTLWGTDKQIDILNFSDSNFPEDSKLSDAINAYHGLFVSAVGNTGENIDKTPNYPSSYTFDNLIAVGAISQNQDRLNEDDIKSNYGMNSVDIYAPGGGIYSTIPTSIIPIGCGYMSGTSMAAPHVAGVAALMLSYNPELNASDLKTFILNNADDIQINTPEGTQIVKKLNAYKPLHALELGTRFGGGNGTTDNPFLIYNETQFRNIRYAYSPVYVPREGTVNQINYAFKLMNNITLQGSWTPFEYPFTGNLNGYGYSITYNMELTKNNLSAENALFTSITSNAYISSLTLQSCSITSDVDTQLTGVNIPEVGILAGYIRGATLSNVKVINPTIECNISNASIGGIAGSIYESYINNCTVDGGSLTSYNGSLGGMAGLGGVECFSGGVCHTTLRYKDCDNVGPVIGNSNENLTVNANVTMEEMKSCIAAGTLITLADGRQVPVESLTGNELLLVWNLYTGQYDVAPILFIDSDPMQKCKVINLSFSDGTSVKVISEHGFWDYNLNKYVYLDEDAAQYVGHWFNRLDTDEYGNFASVRVQLISVTVQEEYTTAYSPVTYGHLCYFVNGMLSMPGGIDGLFNIFEVDSETMAYDRASMEADIVRFGLFTYEEFAELCPITEEAFEAFNGQYLKVAMGKGLIDLETIKSLARRYAGFLGGI